MEQAVQAHGALLVVDAAGLITHATTSTAWVLGHDPMRLIGAPAAAVLTGLTPASWRQAARAARRGGRAYLPLGSWQRREGRLAASVWAHGDCLVLEVEADPTSARARGRIAESGGALAASLSAAPALPALLATLCRGLRRLTGFDRVGVIQFDPHNNGQVVAESLTRGVDGFVGHHFPASDLQPPARENLGHLPLHAIVDVERPASPLCSAPGAGGDAMPASGPLDLHRAQVGAPSPLHLQSLRDMQVAASLTLSLVCAGRLWGLVACHHRQPRLVAVAVRQVCAMIAAHASASIEARERSSRAQVERRARRLAARMRAEVAQAPDTARALMRPGSAVLSLFGDMAGGSVAVWVHGRWSLFGEVPPLAALRALKDWLACDPSRAQFFHCENLGAVYPPAQSFAATASGLVALAVDGREPTVVMWLFPEQPRDICWAGNPDRGLCQHEDEQQPPWRSFAPFQEVLRGRCRPLRPERILAARALRRTIIEGHLQRQVVRERRSRRAAEQQRWRSALLARATAGLGDCRDLDRCCWSLTSVLAGPGGDWCLVLVPGRDGWRAAGACHATGQGQAVLDELAGGCPFQVDVIESMMARRRQRASLVLPSPSKDEVAQLIPEPSQRALVVDRLGLGSLVVAPLLARNTCLGYLVIARAPASYPFDGSDGEFAAEVARRTAAAVDIAASFHQTQEALATRNQVLGVVSHDLRNPLNVIRLNVDALKRKRVRRGDQQVLSALPRALDATAAACRRMDRLIEDVLMVSKADAGTLTMEPAPHAAGGLVDQAIAEMEMLARHSRVSLAARVDAHDAMVLCDRDRVMQVFGNLVGNAIKFSPADSTIEVTSWQDGDEVAFAVRDQGPGIAHQDLPRVFDRHWQAASSRRHGAGLGLTIVKTIVEAHQGRIAVDSRLGEGTTFAFHLRRLVGGATRPGVG